MGTARLKRLLRMLTLLQTGRASSAATLAEELGISKRTVCRDLTLLMAAGVNVTYSRSAGGYCVGQSALSALEDVTLPETLALLIMCRVLRAHPAIWQEQAADRIAQKVEATIPRRMRDTCQRLVDCITVLDRHSPSRRNIKDVIEVLLFAIGQSCKVIVKYRALGEYTAGKDCLRPYRLVLVADSWHLVAFAERERVIRTYEIEEIASVSPTREPFRIPRDFDVNVPLRALEEKQIEQVETQARSSLACSSYGPPPHVGRSRNWRQYINARSCLPR